MVIWLLPVCSAAGRQTDISFQAAAAELKCRQWRQILQSSSAGGRIENTNRVLWNLSVGNSPESQAGPYRDSLLPPVLGG